MKNYLSHQTQTDLVKLGIYQIAGGGLGILFILWSIYKSVLITGYSALLHLFIITLLGFSVFCGTRCLYYKKDALSYSIANQLLQIIHFNVAGFGLKYIAGFHVSIEADLTDSVQFGLSAGLSDIELIINRETENAKAGFNLVAVFLVYQIDKLAQRAKEEKAMQIVHEIGNNP